MIEVYKYLHGLSPQLMNDIFTLRKNPYNILCNIRLIGSKNALSVGFRLDAIAFSVSQLWQKVPIEAKDLLLLETFKAKLKLWN